ncbi:hypothetical protein BROUX41_000326 [Berkeleyomyces rouxiae]|uniref:uncharacterized protein n=1 Tax=Berkeleyomyces rouxiae TaxID=2035830 RepID=UPI003B807851
MPAPEYVLRFATTDNDASSFVLVHAIQVGDAPLDFKLVGTEGAAPYVTTIQSAHISGFKSKKTAVPDVEWEAILKGVLTQEPLKDIQVLAEVYSEASINLAIRRNVQGYSTRLGTIVLTHDPNEEIELMEWCSTAAQTSASHKNALDTNVLQVSQLQKTIEDLKAQMAELIDAKAHDESVMLQKFCNLLNEKKLKIRQQQTVIAESGAAMATMLAKASDKSDTKSDASADTDQEAPRQQTRSTRGRGGRGARVAQPSRPQKRKASMTRRAQAASETESDSGFERMQVDDNQTPKSEPDSRPQSEDEALSDKAQTTDSEETRQDEADSGTADEEDSNYEVPPKRTSTRRADDGANTKKAKALEDDETASFDVSVNKDDNEASVPPPPRVLPFSSRSKKPPTIAADDETTGDEDEL